MADALGMIECRSFAAMVEAADATREVTLTENASGHFECRWVTLRVEPEVGSGWLSTIAGTVIRCPVAHGEGRLATTDAATTEALERDGRVAFRYLAAGVAPDGGHDPAGGRYPANPNGSVADIAGLCDHSGTVVGLMPHPEDHVLDWQRPNGAPGGRECRCSTRSCGRPGDRRSRTGPRPPLHGGRPGGGRRHRLRHPGQGARHRRPR